MSQDQKQFSKRFDFYKGSLIEYYPDAPLSRSCSSCGRKENKYCSYLKRDISPDERKRATNCPAYFKKDKPQEKVPNSKKSKKKIAKEAKKKANKRAAALKAKKLAKVPKKALYKIGKKVVSDKYGNGKVVKSTSVYTAVLFDNETEPRVFSNKVIQKTHVVKRQDSFYV